MPLLHQFWLWKFPGAVEQRFAGAVHAEQIIPAGSDGEEVGSVRAARRWYLSASV
jgi:hypothetical protein